MTLLLAFEIGVAVGAAALGLVICVGLVVITLVEVRRERRRRRAAAELQWDAQMRATMPRTSPLMLNTIPRTPYAIRQDDINRQLSRWAQQVKTAQRK